MGFRDVMKKFVVTDEQGEQPVPDPTQYYQPEPPPAPSPTYAAPQPPPPVYAPPTAYTQPPTYAPPQPPPPAATTYAPSPPAATTYYAPPPPEAYVPQPTYVSPPSPTLPPTVLLRPPADPAAAAPAPPPAPALSGDELATIYQEAGIPPVAWGAEEALNFIAEQSVDDPDAAVSRNLLGCIRSLSRTFPGLTPETVAEDAHMKAMALTNSGGEQSAKLAKFIADTEREIGALREQIQQRLKAIDAGRSKDLQTTQRLREHAEGLKKVERFLRPNA